ncbi:MAG: CapA family protein [Oscillospiraceae bacterium]|nr:CapA family protein [Oscillospiraceae bacterium]
MAHKGKRERSQPRNKRRHQPLWLSVVEFVAAVAVIFGAICALRSVLGIESSQTEAPGAETGVQERESAAPETGSTETPVGETADAETEPAETETTAAEPVTVTISAVGDCTLGTDENFNQTTSLPAYADTYGLDYFLSNVADIFEADDLTIVNFEGVLTTSTSRANKTYAFKGDPSYTEILTSSGVEACNLANNHSHDYGSDSFTDTVTYLEDAGLITFGYDSVAVTEVNGVKVGLVGIYELAKLDGCAEDLEACMEEVKNQGVELIIVTFHWGTEKATVPDSTQISLAHEAVDLGANLVIGHHPHVLQGIEEYNGVNIVYSLGNFCFGGNSNPSDKDTMIYQQTFTIVDGEVQADLDVNIIPCSLSSVSSYNDYRPTPATGDEATRILEKIQERSEAIG